jgi:peptidase M23-like protein
MKSNMRARAAGRVCRYNAPPMRRAARHPRRRAGTILGCCLLASCLHVGAAPAASSPGRSTSTAPGSLRWPLDLPHTILSSFGEYRYDHLHAGIDISTGGGTGYKVLAAAAGEIFRLKVEWRGYGRALYLRHPGGRVTVYGHLERYEDRVLGLERLVARRQAAAGTRYPGDIYLDNPVRVARGQVIAYSGESGVGLPHLHFEVRDGGDAPIDPFRAGLPRPDDRRPPVLDSLTVTAAAASTFVDGDLREKLYPLQSKGGGVVTTPGPVKVSGPFLAALDAYDPAGDSGRAGVSAIDVAIDGRPHYHFAIRSFRFDQYPQSGLVFDHRLSRLGPSSFGYRIYRLPGSDFGSEPENAPSNGHSDYPGAFDLPPGSHLMEISVRDDSANLARARVCIQVGRPQVPETLDWAGATGGVIGVRFRPAPDDPGATSAPAGAASSGCPSSARGVEAESWDETERRWSPMTCRVKEGTCAPVPEMGRRGLFAVRLRETLNGVPGPWRILTRDVAASPAPANLTVRVEPWPSFLDFMAPLDDPRVPELRLAAGLDRRRVENFTYRGDLACAATLAYDRAAGTAPFFVLADGLQAPLASLALDVRWVEPGHALEYHGPGFSLLLPEKARFFAGPLALRTERTPGTEKLPSQSDAIEILPEGEALDDRATLSFDLTPGAVPPESLGIYRWDPFRNRWSYEGGNLEEGGTRLSLPFRRYGRFALLQDASPPVLLEVRPPGGSRSTNRRPALVARVEDEGKGLNYDGVTFELDGAKLESEFDPDRGQAKVLDPPRLGPGTHHLRVVAVDLAGNASEPVEEDFHVLDR